MSNARAEFAAAVAVPDEQIDLARVALLFAREEYPALDTEKYLARLDMLAAAAGERVGDAPTCAQAIARLADFIHGEQGFRGNSDDYSNPRNSYLNEVLDRRLGIPITLSVVWMEIARRLRLPIVGVGLPGHFIVKWCQSDDEATLIDPFNAGRVLTLAECQERLRDLYGSEPVWRHTYLDRARNRDIIARMLRNLKSNYLQNDDSERALRVIQKILMVTPESAEDVRDLGLMHLQRRESRVGLDCLERYLQLSPQSQDAENVKEIIRSVRGKIAQWN